MSIRELAARHGVHRRTVRQALASAEPPPRKVPVRTAPVLDPVGLAIDAMLRADLDAPRKKAKTVLRIRERLLEEHQLVVAYSTVRDYVREARPRIAAAGRGAAGRGVRPRKPIPPGRRRRLISLICGSCGPG